MTGAHHDLQTKDSDASSSEDDYSASRIRVDTFILAPIFSVTAAKSS